MKRFLCLLMCLMILPVCAVAERSFPVDAASFQWHIADMIEQYYVWESMGEVNGKLQLYGMSYDGYPDLVILTDSADRLYEVRVSAVLDPAYDPYTLETMDAVLRGAEKVASYLAITTNGSVDIRDVFTRGTIRELYDEVQRNRSLSLYANRPFQKSYSVRGVECVQRLELVRSDRMFYEISFVPGW